MEIHQQAFHEILSILRSWDGKRFYWIHLRNEPGSGCSTLLRYLEKKKKRLPYPLFRINFSLTTVHPAMFLRWMLRETFPPPSRLSALLEDAPPVYRQWIAQQFNAFLKSKTMPTGNKVRNGWQLLRWRLQQYPIFLMVDDFPNKLKNAHHRLWHQWFTVFQSSRVLLLTAGHTVPEIEGQHPDYVLTLPGITMKGATEFLQQKYGIFELVARMLVNQLYLKSEGNLQKLHWLVRTFFPDVLAHSGKSVPIEMFQRKIHVPHSSQQLLRKILEQLPLAHQQILGLFSRLERPIPTKLAFPIIERAGFSRDDLLALTHEQFLEKESLGKENYFLMKDSPLKEFLKVHISGDLLTPFQGSVQSVATRKSLPFAAGFYRVLLDSGYVTGALEVAFNEARCLVQQEEWEEAAEFLHFLRRNQDNLSEERRIQVLRWLATFYQKNGLVENYFETLREYRDVLGKKATQEYLKVSLEMAEALLKMDAFGEARYLIREARAIKIAQPDTRFKSMLLAGDLERYLGHPEYAVHQYREALRLLPKVPDSQHFVLSLYQRFQEVVQDGIEDVELDALAQALMPLSQRSPTITFRIGIDWIRRHMQQASYRRALTIAIDLYRQLRFQLTPEMVVTLDQLLGELYGTAGKWRLAAYHLRRALLMTAFASASVLKDDLLLAMGVVFKETGAYQKAIRFFERVHQQAGLRGDYLRFVQAKLHLAHIHILVHNPLKALDFIRSALRMEETLRDATLILTAKLLSVSLELQQGNYDKAAAALDAARDWAWQTMDPVDTLHWQYYEILYAIKAGKVAQAEEKIRHFREKIPGLAKFAILSDWLSAQIYQRQTQWERAITTFQQAFQAAWQYGMWHLAFQIGLDYLETVLSHGKPRHKRTLATKVAECFQQLHQAVEDPILQKQLEESSEGDRFKQLMQKQNTMGEEHYVP